MTRGGWQRTHPVDPLPAGWGTRIKPRILTRDGHQCMSEDKATGKGCVAKAIEVDHVIPRSQGGTHEDANLAAICVPHHRAKTALESMAARVFTARPKEKHPGLM